LNPVSTRRGPSASGSVQQVFSARWAPSATPWTNAVAESFFATLQTELLDRHRWATRAQLAQAIFERIEVFYNQQRRHSTLDMHPPVTYATAAHTGSAA
jgi:transposase InsO family protein